MSPSCQLILNDGVAVRSSIIVRCLVRAVGQEAHTFHILRLAGINGSGCLAVLHPSRYMGVHSGEKLL